MPELVNLSEASRRTGKPRTTVAGWVRREKMFPAGLAEDGTALYDLAVVQRLAQATQSRRRAPGRRAR